MINQNVIRNRRNDLGLTLEDMAQKTHYRSINGYWRIESGLTDPSSSKLILIAKALDLPIAHLLETGDKEVE